ncbi:MAG: N-acetyl sugar amidotransferase [Candidatus Omnitrophica bacterium]|nr:N-acetyl sugar amidotransferase [Candidatus Omnitrophota bacterium]
MTEKSIKYCKRCVMPETRPDLYIDEEGVCNACRSFTERKSIDWNKRKEELVKILDRYRSKNNSNYDCIIPVSGGKDSHFQTLKMLELGMNPLCVTATTCKLSDIGRRNIENLKKLGVDYIEVTTNRVVRRKINRFAMSEVGDISWPEHLTIFTIPVRIAVQFNVPLIIWGENSQNEYGGPAAAAENNVLDRPWLEKFGGLLGLKVSDLIGKDGIEAKHLIQFTYPKDEELKRVGVTGLFLGHYTPWDSYSNALVAQAHGLETYPKNVEGNLVNYENLDNCQMRIHDYFKFLKFGFGRVTDYASLNIRRGRLTREEGLDAVKRLDGKFPWTYLGYSLEEILGEMDMTIEEFTKICDRFTNKKLFVCDSRGSLLKDKSGNLTRINDDNVVKAAYEKSSRR